MRVCTCVRACAQACACAWRYRPELLRILAWFETRPGRRLPEFLLMDFQSASGQVLVWYIDYIIATTCQYVPVCYLQTTYTLTLYFLATETFVKETARNNICFFPEEHIEKQLWQIIQQPTINIVYPDEECGYDRHPTSSFCTFRPISELQTKLLKYTAV